MHMNKGLATQKFDYHNRKKKEKKMVFWPHSWGTMLQVRVHGKKIQWERGECTLYGYKYKGVIYITKII